ncbi:hypothetical protein HU200_054242 [Digitaria exilis]|uniref:Uncharacterized protein n=1 Tax=Digitaria exilis TaxID=1010633 RepID=A0A835E5P2_9POAL|nr:hypothetical protein HU200_054242 [Digitaria exilis]
MVDWWLQIRRSVSKDWRKGVDSMVLLVSWRLWKMRNDCVFNAATPTITELIRLLLEDANLWMQAGASHLAALGWPTATTARST